MNKKEFIKYLRKQVKNFGTQEELAQRAGVSRSYLSYVLNGKRKPNKILCRFFDIEIETRYLEPRAK